MPIPSDITMSPNAQSVSVGDFRDLISNLERLINCDYHSCVDHNERARWVRRARSVGSELIGTSCPRATTTDWIRREKAIERSASLIGRNMERFNRN